MTTTSTGGTVTISSPLTKNDIVKRLLEAKQITFEEMLILIESGEKEYVYVPQTTGPYVPALPPYPVYPTQPYPYFSYTKF